MKHLKKFKNFEKTNELFGFGFYRGDKDEDLGKQILKYLEGLSTNYGSCPDLYQVSNNIYAFVETSVKVFPNDNKTNHRIRIDVCKGYSPEFDDPYTIYLSTLGDVKPVVDVPILTDRQRAAYPNSLNRSTNSSNNLIKIDARTIDEKPADCVKLDISKKLKEEIFSKIEKIYGKTNINLKGDVRGGKNSITKSLEFYFPNLFKRK